MISSYLGFQLYANDPARSLQTVSDEGAVKSAKAYYDANIGKVKSVDDLLGNYRLFSYAMKAYGLSDMTYARGLMRQVLTSDLSDAHSVANKLSDPRYLAFAKAFNFTSKGTVAATSIQGGAQVAATVASFAAATAGTLSTATANEATAYYQSHIGAVTTVADLEKDSKLTAYVLTALGLDATTPASRVTAVLESRLSDPTSLVNTTAGAGYAALEAAVHVTSTGAASTVLMPAQSSDAVTATVQAYAATVGSASGAQAAAAKETSYYTTTMPTITSVGALLADHRLVAYILKAYDLPSSTPSLMLGQVLTSDLSDPTSLANTLRNPAFKDVAAAFNFASDGTLRTEPFQDAAQQHDTVALYAARQTGDTPASESETAYYKATIGSIKTVAGLEGDARLLAYVETAYGIDPKTPTATLNHIFADSPTDPAGIVATTAGSHDLALARAFDVDATGAATDVLQAQSAAAVSTATAALLAAAPSGDDAQAAARREAAYYTGAIADVTSVGDLLADKRLTADVIKAFGLPASTSTDRLRQVLTSDLTKPNNAAAKLGDSYVTLARAFQFAPDGTVAHQAVQLAQSTADTTATDTAYVRQTMETEAGAMNTGTQLALYFQRVAPTIKNAYAILADKALVQVFQTMLGLSANSGKADIDVQARFLASKINFKDLQDPAKVLTMVRRFAAMYDLQNPTTKSSSGLVLLASSTSS